MQSAEVERIVQSELGVRISKGFSFFDSEPLAAASLGQVHRAVLRDGRLVTTEPGADFTEDRLIALMVGRALETRATEAQSRLGELSLK